MRLHLLQFVILLSALATGASASEPPTHVALPAQARTNISSLEIVTAISQRQLDISVNPTPMRGLIPGIADSIRYSNAKSAVEPLQTALADFDFDEVVQVELRSAIGQIPWAHVRDGQLIKQLLAESFVHALADSKDGALLFDLTDYDLSEDGSKLIIRTTVNLYVNSEALAAFKPAGGRKDKPYHWSNALYRGSFIFEAEAPGATGDRNLNIAAWSANKGESMRSALKLGATKLAQMLATDLQGYEPTVANVSVAPIKTVRLDGEEGQVVTDEADGLVVRLKDGTLKYAARSVLQPKGL